MTVEDAVRLRAVLDRLVREKEIAAQFFGRMAVVQPDVEHRRWFRRMAQDEKDQRKILMKHRREICGSVVLPTPPVLSPIHQAIEPTVRSATTEFVDALRVAIRIAEESRAFTAYASDLTAERSCRIFLKILAQECAVHRDELLAELRRHETESVAA